MPFHSKTVIGLIFLVLIAVGMAAIGKLTPELVDVIKWVGTAFMAVRAVSNHAEGKNANSRSGVPS